MDLRAKLSRLRAGSTGPGALTPAAAHAHRLPMLEPLTPSAADVFELPPNMPGSDPKRAERIARLRALIGEVAVRDRSRSRTQATVAAESRTLPWPSVRTAQGPLCVLERWLEPHHHHGRAAVRNGVCTQPGTMAVLARDASLADLDLSCALFLDIETTGLAGGTGTVAFLVGLARFAEGALCIEQLIVPELGGEAPVLSRLAERIAAASCVITYNGKSFDWPLLRTRFVLSRLPVPALPAHIDLLHAARSIWKRRLASVRLTEIEREILHFERADDIPGAEIPGRYFEYLRCGRAECLAPILEHNQNDLIALAALLGVMITRFEQLDALCDARDALAFGRLSLRARDAERALRFANAALSSSDADAVTRHALLFASEVRRELGETRHAAELLEQALLLAPEPPLRASIHVRLAKLYEHDLDQLSSALRHARHTEAAEGAHGHGRRLGRLHRRLLRPASATSRSAT